MSKEGKRDLVPKERQSLQIRDSWDLYILVRKSLSGGQVNCACTPHHPLLCAATRNMNLRFWLSLLYNQIHVCIHEIFR